MSIQKFISIAFYILLITFLFPSCKKENSDILFSPVSSGTDFNLYSVRKLSGASLIACGGKDGKGIILLSTNNGDSWHLLNDNFDQVLYDVYFIDHKIGFAGGGTPDVFKTTDGGNTWNKIYIPFPDFPLNYRVPLRKIFFVTDSLGFICGGGRFEAGIIFKTTDQGQTWTLNLFQHELRGILFSNPTTGFTCGYGAIMKTTDSGITWNFIDSPNEFYTSLEKNSNSIWASGYNGTILNSESNGIEWKNKNSGNNAFSSRSHFNCVVSTASGTLVAAGNDGVSAISEDNGNSWNQGESFDGVTIKSVLLLNENSGIAVGNDGKIFKFSF